jgi:hypothetical protein
MCGFLVFFPWQRFQSSAFSERWPAMPPDIGNVISQQNHEIEKLAIFIYDTVHNEPNTLTWNWSWTCEIVKNKPQASPHSFTGSPQKSHFFGPQNSIYCLRERAIFTKYWSDPLVMPWKSKHYAWKHSEVTIGIPYFDDTPTEVWQYYWKS